MIKENETRHYDEVRIDRDTMESAYTQALQTVEEWVRTHIGASQEILQPELL